MSAHPESLFHVEFGAVQPSRGDNLCKVSAYNACSKLRDLRDGSATTFDFTRKQNEHEGGCIMLPDGASPELQEPEKLWNAAQTAETRRDGQPARLIEFSIPRQIPPEDRLDFARSVTRPWVEHDGAAAQIDLHCPLASDGQEQPHAHVILSRRALNEDGFAKKKLPNDPWTQNRGRDMRAAVSSRMNQWLEQHEISTRVDHRSHKERGDDTPPEPNVSRRAVEAWKNAPDDAEVFPEIIAQRDTRLALRAESHELTAAESEISDIRYELGSRAPGMRNRRRKPRLDPARLPKVGGQIVDVSHDDKSAVITLKSGSEIRVRPERMIIRGRADDRAIAALADQARQQGWQHVELTGDQRFRERLAAALELRGIEHDHDKQPSQTAHKAAVLHSPEHLKKVRARDAEKLSPAPEFVPPWERKRRREMGRP
ncbi:MobA/MobL family protein [Fodinicurvata sediminis]|uniref:MobA/MobL family protein n=1 Tax=Fodinicurvata sediminis TaxID=1121832 RepID=UPI0003B4A998|nr:MobA/MobL family protein [Fodinicurvata sediminis]